MDSEDSLSNLELASSVAGGGSTQRRQSGTSESDQQQRPAQQAGLQVHVDLRQPLSLRGDDVEQIVRTRNTDALLRPVYLNAVEVGYAYNQSNDLDKRLPVRGVTIALWYFIARGHQAIALLPYCFKSYPDKSTAWGELMSLYKMNLIEFTPGYGSDKYTEVNRILAIRADETGGCIVARSQMQNIVEECPDLDRIIERRLLMPSFNGEDVIFPIDGPLGRSGPSLQQTLECQDSCDEFPRCALYQMSLDDQRIWLEKLCGLVINNHTLSASWSLMCNSICTSSLTSSALAQFISSRTKAIISTALNGGVPLKPHPPETNPIDNIGYSYTRGALRRAVSEQMYYSNSARPNNANPAPSPSYPSSDLNATTSLNRRYTPSTGNQRQRQNGNDVFIPEYMQCSDEELPQPLSTSIRPAPRQVEQQHPQAGDKSPLAGVPSALTKPVQPPLPNYLGSNANSIYRLTGTPTRNPQVGRPTIIKIGVTPQSSSSPQQMRQTSQREQLHTHLAINYRTPSTSNYAQGGTKQKLSSSFSAANFSAISESHLRHQDQGQRYMPSNSLFFYNPGSSMVQNQQQQQQRRRAVAQQATPTHQPTRRSPSTVYGAVSFEQDANTYGDGSGYNNPGVHAGDSSDRQTQFDRDECANVVANLRNSVDDVTHSNVNLNAPGNECSTHAQEDEGRMPRHPHQQQRNNRIAEGTGPFARLFPQSHSFPQKRRSPSKYGQSSAHRQHNNSNNQKHRRDSGHHHHVSSKDRDGLLVQLMQIFGFAKASRVMAKYPRVRNLTALIEHCLRETDVPGDDDDFIRELNPTFSENSGVHHENSNGVNVTDRSSTSRATPTGTDEKGLENEENELIRDLIDLDADVVQSTTAGSSGNDDDPPTYLTLLD